MSLDYSPEVLRQHAHYKEVRARLNPPPAIKPAPMKIVVQTVEKSEPVAEVKVPVFCEPGQRDWLDVSVQYAISDVINEVCKQFGVRRLDIESDRRDAGIIPSRHAAMTLAWYLTRHSPAYIGKRFGGRDRTTVIHAWVKFEPVMLAAAKKLPPAVPLAVWVDAFKREMALTPPVPRKQYTRKAVEPIQA